MTKLTPLLLLSCCAWAQEFRGTILGRVTDSSGAVVVNAAVSVTNHATNTVVKTATAQAGTYTVPFLLPGAYTISVQARGPLLPNVKTAGCE